MFDNCRRVACAGFAFLQENALSSCSDKSKEIVGWGQVICTEVSEYEVTGQKPSWWENLFGNSNNPK